jgi:DNA-binding PadR family transcriptional regulator
MALANKTRYAILGGLNLMPMSGYDFKKFSDISIAHFWNENYARIYPVLKELEKEGWWSARPAAAGAGRPAMSMPSPTGQRELEQWLRQPPEDQRLREEILLKMFFSEDVPPASLLRNLAVVRERNQKYLDEYLGIERFLNTDANTRETRAALLADDAELWQALPPRRHPVV